MIFFHDGPNHGDGDDDDDADDVDDDDDDDGGDDAAPFKLVGVWNIILQLRTGEDDVRIPFDPLWKDYQGVCNQILQKYIETLLNNIGRPQYHERLLFYQVE